jgi:hypothetical protein
MKTFGSLISLFAFILAFYALTMDVSISNGLGNKIVNIHLITQQQNLLLMSLMLLLLGLVFILLGRKSKVNKKTNTSINTELFKKIPTENGFNYTLNKKDGVSFNIVKSKLLELYTKESFTIKEDSKESLFMKKSDSKAYIDAKDKGSFIALSVWNTITPDFIDELYGLEKQEQPLNSTDKLIELSKMLEKGIISKEEFLSLKNNIITK